MSKMMTGIVHANCPNCGVVECQASEVTIRCYAEAMQNTYRFRCPECHSWIARTAGPAVVTMLLQSGAQVETARLPREIHERSVVATPISDDDVIDFHQALEQLPTFQQQTGGISE